jgi:hypothetical protein
MALPAAALANDAYRTHVNPQWVRLLNLLEMNVGYEGCSGIEFAANGIELGWRMLAR